MLSCAQCGEKFERPGGRGPKPKFCSVSCRSRAQYARLKAGNPCPGCGEPMALRASSSADDQRCRRCRTTSEHGTYAMYKKHGCRCEPCRKANTAEHARWRARRKRLDKPVKPTARRDCDECGEAFLGRLDTGQRFCSTGCAKRAQGYDGAARTKFKIADAVRLEIYEAAGWVCALCEAPVRPDADPNHPRYPTLDHIEPRSFGGSDDRSNLRLACRQCNTLRGVNVDWVPVKAVA